MANQEQVANFVQRHVAVGRVRPGTNYHYLIYYGVPYHPPLPTIEEAGEAFFQSAEFGALQLGSLLNTPTGQFLEQAVELVVPRVLGPEFDLIVAALRYAAARQQGVSRARAAVTLGGGVLVALLVKELGRAA